MEVRLYYILYSSVLSLSKIYCIYRPDQGLQPSHQEGSIHSPADDGLPPPSSPRMITSLREDMQGTVQYVGSTSDPFPIKSGVKQGCVLAPTPFGMFFFLLLSYPFSQSNKWCVP